MKVNSDFIWAVVLLAVAAVSFFLGIKKGSIGAEDQLQDQLKEIRLLEDKNQQLSDELTSRGIYSYPQANIVSKVKDSVAMALITLNGKDAIENLKVRRNLFRNYSRIQSNIATEAASSGKLTDLGILRQHNPSAFDVPITGKEVAIQLDFESGRNKWQQYIWIKKSGDGKIKTFWIITNGNSQIIDKHIDPDFPVNVDGKVVLWEDRSIDYSNLEMNSTFPPRD